MAFIRKSAPLHNEVTQQKLAALKPFYLLIDPSECWVSSRSQWKDLVWDLDAKFANVNWEFELPNGSLLSAPENAKLLDELRRLFWSFFCDTSFHAGLSLTNATAMFGRLRELTRWVIYRQYRRVADLNSVALEEFIDDLICVATERDGVLKEQEVEGQNAEADILNLSEEDEPDLLWEEEWRLGLISNEIWNELRDDRSIFGRLYNSLRLWEHIYTRGQVINPVIPVMAANPFAGSSAYAISKKHAIATYELIPPLPDEVAIPIMNAASAWLGNRADDICELAEACAEIVKRCRRKRTGWMLMKEDADYLRSFQFSKDPGSSESWRKPITVARLRGYDTFPSFDIASLITLERGACLLVINSETGVRPEELSKIPVEVRAGSSVARGPYHTVPTPSGLNQLWFLQSLLSKAQPVPVLEDWLVGSTPTGSSHVPAPVRAIDVLIRLLAPWRALSDKHEVASRLLVHGLGANFPTKGENIFASETVQIRRVQRAFITQCVDLSGLPERSKRDECLAEYRQTNGKCIYPSQWRKTFAMYTIRVDSTMIPEVALQFHHMSVAMTESRYIGSNIDLLKEIDTQQARAAASLLYEAVRGIAPAAGRAAKLIKKYLPQILAVMGEARGVRAITVLEKWCEQRGIKVFPTGPGNCFVSLWPSDAECHKAAGTAHWSNRTPNYSHKSPSVCAGCKCFGIDTSHAQFWVNRYIEYQTWVDWAAERGLLAGMRVSRARAKQAAGILFLLRIELPDLVKIQKKKEG